MAVRVVREGAGHRLDGEGPVTEVANRFLAHLQARGFAAGTVRGYAYDLLNLSRFLAQRGMELTAGGPTDLFDWLAWQSRPQPLSGKKVVRLAEARGAAPATMSVGSLRPGDCLSSRSSRGCARTTRCPRRGAQAGCECHAVGC